MREHISSLQNEEKKHHDVIMPREQAISKCLFRMEGQTLHCFDCDSKQFESHFFKNGRDYSHSDGSERFVCLSNQTIMITGGKTGKDRHSSPTTRVCKKIDFA